MIIEHFYNNTLFTCKNKNSNSHCQVFSSRHFDMFIFFKQYNWSLLQKQAKISCCRRMVMLHEMVYTPRNLLMVIILLAFLNPIQRSGCWICTTAKCLHCHFSYTWTNLYINVFCTITPRSFTNRLIQHDLAGRGHVFFLCEVTPLRSRDHWRPLPLSRCQNYIYKILLGFFPLTYVLCVVIITQKQITYKSKLRC